uniref:Uncharacterized protein n=1 Tax=Romanomermis culicivorax TaxID=13658 RepID=A0A915IR96_ROMCU
IDSEDDFIEENNNTRQQRVFRPLILIVTKLLTALLQYEKPASHGTDPATFHDLYKENLTPIITGSQNSEKVIYEDKSCQTDCNDVKKQGKAINSQKMKKRHLCFMQPVGSEQVEEEDVFEMNEEGVNNDNT